MPETERSLCMEAFAKSGGRNTWHGECEVEDKESHVQVLTQLPDAPCKSAALSVSNGISHCSVPNDTDSIINENFFPQPGIRSSSHSVAHAITGEPLFKAGNSIYPEAQTTVFLFLQNKTKYPGKPDAKKARGNGKECEIRYAGQSQHSKSGAQQ